jgi:hypothetical protein
MKAETRATQSDLLPLGLTGGNRSGEDSKACAGVTQLVECDLAKVDVAGSNPVSRSKLLEAHYRFSGILSCAFFIESPVPGYSSVGFQAVTS